MHLQHMNNVSAKSIFREWKDGRLPSVHTPFVPVAVGQKVVPALPVGPLYLNRLIHRFLTRLPCGDRSNIKLYVAQHLKVLKVGTACSGTDGPLLCWTAISEVLQSELGASLTVQHTFSAELKTDKQGFIRRVFPGTPVMFKDCTELQNS